MEPREILILAILAMADQERKPFRLALRKSILDCLTTQDIQILEEKFDIILERRDDFD